MNGTLGKRTKPTNNKKYSCLVHKIRQQKIAIFLLKINLARERQIEVKNLFALDDV